MRLFSWCMYSTCYCYSSSCALRYSVCVLLYISVIVLLILFILQNILPINWDKNGNELWSGMHKFACLKSVILTGFLIESVQLNCNWTLNWRTAWRCCTEEIHDVRQIQKKSGKMDKKKEMKKNKRENE